MRRRARGRSRSTRRRGTRGPDRGFRATTIVGGEVERLFPRCEGRRWRCRAAAAVRPWRYIEVDVPWESARTSEAFAQKLTVRVALPVRPHKLLVEVVLPVPSPTMDIYREHVDTFPCGRCAHPCHGWPQVCFRVVYPRILLTSGRSLATNTLPSSVALLNFLARFRGVALVNRDIKASAHFRGPCCGSLPLEQAC